MSSVTQPELSEKGGTIRTAPGVETPSGKGATDENFPVGSILLPAHLRPHVAAFYDFARAADDIADNKALRPQDKINRLNLLEEALVGHAPPGPGYDKAHALRRSLAATGVTARHARDLLAAFRQDAMKSRYKDWQDLLDYCELSANPVGRFLLDLHGEDKAGYAQSDALCTVLQIINHLQDCGDDYRDLDRVYIPQDMMAAEHVGAADLSAPSLKPGMRAVLDHMLARVDEMNAVAAALPGVLGDRRLAMESAVIVRLARRLTTRLKAGDPLVRRVALSKADFAWAGATGMIAGFFSARRESADARARAHAKQVVVRSGTSFGLGMRILPKERRAAMYAIYAFCREIDDIADEPGAQEDKLNALRDWRTEIDRLYEGRATKPTARALALARLKFNLPKEEFLMLIEGMEWDAKGPYHPQSVEELLAYCRRVAGAVGLLSMPVFGAAPGTASDDFALALANALQLTNILRDIAEDAALGRLYLPGALLDKYGITTRDPQAVMAHQGLEGVTRELGGLARNFFHEAQSTLKKLRRAEVRPALLMMGIYEGYLTALEARGWDKAATPVKLTKGQKLRAALRALLFPSRAL